MKSKLILALATVSLVSVGCGNSKNSSPSSVQVPNGTKIIGGEAVTESDAISKSIVAVIDVKVGGLCTGTIISSNLIVTAGHCAQSEASDLRIVFGLNVEDKANRIVRGVDSLVVNPGYAQTAKDINAAMEAIVEEAAKKDPDFDPKHPSPELVARLLEIYTGTNNRGDIALLKLHSPIPAGYVPAEILSDKKAIQNSSQVLLAGYGITHPEVKAAAPDQEQFTVKSHMDFNFSSETEGTILRKVVVSVKDSAFSPTEVLLDQTQGKGACHGDSGGPAYSSVNGKLYVWGVTSRGIKDPSDSCGSFSAYTNMVDYIDWIKQSAVHLGAQF